MACGLDLARLRSLSPGLLHELCSIVWFVYLTDQLSFQVKMSHPCHLCCLGLLCANSLCDAGVLCPLTGVSNPSPSSTNEHMSFLCLRSVLPQDQTTGHLTEQLSERSLSLECICVYLYIYQWGTDLWNTCITAQHCKRCFVLLLPYLIIMLLKSQALEQWLRCLPSLSPSPSISQINFFFLFFYSFNCLCTLGWGTNCIHQMFLVTLLGYHPEFMINFLSFRRHFSFPAPENTSGIIFIPPATRVSQKLYTSLDHMQ